MLDLVQEIEAQIAGAKKAAARQTIGVIREIGDGVAKVEGLGDAMLNEMLDFGQGVMGLALNLDETEIGVIILGDYTKLEEKLGPLVLARAALSPQGKYEALRDDLIEHYERFNVATDGSFNGEGEYLLAVGQVPAASLPG